MMGSGKMVCRMFMASESSSRTPFTIDCTQVASAFTLSWAEIRASSSPCFTGLLYTHIPTLSWGRGRRRGMSGRERALGARMEGWGRGKGEEREARKRGKGARQQVGEGGGGKAKDRGGEGWEGLVTAPFAS